MVSWKADPYLWWVFRLFVCKTGSPAKLVQHSPARSDLFATHVNALETCPVSGSRIRKMKYVKCRFNSTAVPLQRSMLFFEATWRFCIDVVASRAGSDPAKDAGQFLTSLTEEAVVQAAMMAEGADEHLLVRRFFDKEGWDATSVGSELHNFLSRPEHVFIAQP